MADVATAPVIAPDAVPDAVPGHKYQFNVSMSCGGCSGAVERVLKKLEGVQKYEVSLETKIVTVFADESLPYEKVLQTIAKTGKKVNSGEADGVEQSVDVSAAQ